MFVYVLTANVYADVLVGGEYASNKLISTDLVGVYTSQTNAQQRVYEIYNKVGLSGCKIYTDADGNRITIRHTNAPHRKIAEYRISEKQLDSDDGITYHLN